MSKYIFNSLGSNYDWHFVLKSLAFPFQSPKVEKERLKVYLEKKYQKQVVFFHKARYAIEFALRNFEIGQGDEVMMQAFSCYALEEAIARTGATPVFVDLAQDKLCPSLREIKKLYSYHPKLKALILSYPFGVVMETAALSKFCQQHKIFLIEDLAQAVATKIGSSEVGLFGDATVLSFGRDKTVDGVCGGVALVKNINEKSRKLIRNQFSFKEYLLNLREPIYPFFALLVRYLYPLGLGKILHWILKQTQLFYPSTQTVYSKMTTLPKYCYYLINLQLAKLEESLLHRRKIAQFYFNQLKDLAQIKIMTDKLDIINSCNLRFVISCERVYDLISYLEAHKIHLADRFYKKAIDCGSTKCHSSYQTNSCPRAEKLASSVLNLPTHLNVNLSDAKRICQLIKNFYQQIDA